MSKKKLESTYLVVAFYFLTLLMLTGMSIMRDSLMFLKDDTLVRLRDRRIFFQPVQSLIFTQIIWMSRNKLREDDNNKRAS